MLKDIILYGLLFWAVFGNIDDGFFGPYPKTPGGAIRWWLRNPCHNLTHYVLRWKGGPFHNGDGFYIGWRPDNGALGAARHRWGS